ncbi:MAG: IS66 family insertion sequence element accessory protein TnpB [Nitrososphaerales archaeon]|jgi:transposase
MIQVTPQMRILVAVEPVDFRKGIDGLAGIVKALHLDPFSGCLFVFRSRSGASLRVLAYDSQGYWLCQKRLSKGTFRFWPKAGETLHPLAAHELQALLWNKDPGRVDVWKPLK